MNPVKFPQANATLKGPPDSGIGDLPVHRDGEKILSCWQLGWRERLRILVSGKLFFYVWNPVTQPPVSFSTQDPFKGV
jgi:hypothetical protein